MCDRITGLPEDKSYLECSLPDWLEKSIKQLVDGEKKAETDEHYRYFRLDWDYCNLQSDINVAEVEKMISSEQAWYLRGKYLGLERENI